jgi:hypothetical protein
VGDVVNTTQRSAQERCSNLYEPIIKRLISWFSKIGFQIHLVPLQRGTQTFASNMDIKARMVGLVVIFHCRYCCASKHQLMTAGMMVHVPNLTPGSDEWTTVVLRTVNAPIDDSRHGPDDSQYGPRNQSDTRE